MATVADLLRQLAKEAAPDGGNALVGPLTLAAHVAAPLTLSAPAALTGSWRTATGRPTEAHHALALAALRAGDAVALMGHGAAPHDDLLLLTLARLATEPSTRALWLVGHAAALAQTTALVAALTPTVTVGRLPDGPRQALPQLILLTPDELHRRCLQHADRSWRALWPALRMIALPGLHDASGAAAGHLLWLLRRVARLAAQAQPVVALTPISAAAATLTRLLDRPVRVLATSAEPSTATMIALWRTGDDRIGTLRQLARDLQRYGLALTLVGRDEAETTALRQAVGDEFMVGGAASEVRVVLATGVPTTPEARQALLRAGYRLVLLLAGDTPYEQLLTAQPDVLLQCLPGLALPRSNPQINAAHLVSAAGERPLTPVEVVSWQTLDQVRQLVLDGVLQAVAEGEDWQPTPTAPDPYTTLDLRTAQGAALALIPPPAMPPFIAPAVADHWAVAGSVWQLGWGVAERSAGTVTLEREEENRATWPLTEVHAKLGDEVGSRVMALGTRKTTLRRVKVEVTARQRGLLEWRRGLPPRRLPVANSQERRWKAAALVLSVAPPAQHPAPGWALLHTLDLVALAPPGALIPWVDTAHNQLVLIEAEAGGVGVIEVVFPQVERWLELAFQLATVAAQSTLWGPVAQAELQWLESLHPKPLPAAAPVEVPVQAAVDVMTERPPRVPPPARSGEPPRERPKTPPPVRVQSSPTAPLQPGHPVAPPRPPSQPLEGKRNAGAEGEQRKQPVPSLPVAQAEPAPAAPPAANVPTVVNAARPQALPTAEPETTDELSPPDAPFTELPPYLQALLDRAPAPPAPPLMRPAARRYEVAPPPTPLRRPAARRYEQAMEAVPAPVAPAAMEDDALTAPAVETNLADAADAVPAAPAVEMSVEASAIEPPVVVQQSVEVATLPLAMPPVDDVPLAMPTTEVLADAAPAPEQVMASAPAPLPMVVAENVGWALPSANAPVVEEDVGWALPAPEEQPAPWSLTPALLAEIAEVTWAADAPPDFALGLREDVQWSAAPPPLEVREDVAWARDPLPAPASPPAAPKRPAPPPRAERPPPPKRSTPSAPPAKTERTPTTPPTSPPAKVPPEAGQKPPARPQPPTSKGPLQAGNKPPGSQPPARPQPPTSKAPSGAGSKPPGSQPPVPSATTEAGNKPPTRPQPPAPEPAPDVGGMIARMRALRATREDAPTKLSEDAPGESAVEQRFAAGQRVRAVPYGEGVVRQSRVVAGRELLDIDFPDAGLIAVDAVRGLVRLSEPEPAAPDDEA